MSTEIPRNDLPISQPHRENFYIRIDTPNEAIGLMKWLNFMGQYADQIHAELCRVISVPYALGTERAARNRAGVHRYASVNSERSALSMLPTIGYPIQPKDGQVFAMADLWSRKYDSNSHTWKDGLYLPDLSQKEVEWAKQTLTPNRNGELWHTAIRRLERELKAK